MSTLAPAVGINPTAVHQADAPCFCAVDHDGRAYELGDGIPHWATASEGYGALYAIRQRDRGLKLRLTRESASCWHVTCSGCGYRYDEEEWSCHFATQALAQETAADSGWRVIEGRLLCDGCGSGASGGEDA